MDTLRVSLFPRFRLEHDNQRVEIDIRKVQELFSYLVLFHVKAHHREELANLLWHEASAIQSRRMLRKTLWQLQNILKEKWKVLYVENDWLQLDPKADVWVDALIFEQTYQCVNGIPGRQLKADQIEVLRMAAELYMGDLLEGWYYDWCVYERERFQFMYLAILDKLISYFETNGECELGIEYAIRTLRYDNTRERTHRQLMMLYYAAGDRIAALHQFERCRTILLDEIGVEPDQQTVSLYTRIRANRLSPPSSLYGSAATLPLPQLYVIFERLNYLHKSLDDLQKEVDMEIGLVKQLLEPLAEDDIGLDSV